MRPFSTALLSALLLSTPALAGDVFSFGIGAQAVAGMNWMDSAPGNVLPGYAGFRTGAGATAELRVLGMVGLEAGLIRSNDRGEGSVSMEGLPSVSSTIGQVSWHVPLVVKVVVPLPLLKPFALAGVDMVLPGSCSSIGVSCTSSGYGMWVGGVGAELAIPVPVLDLVRIPLSLRYEQNRDSTALSTRGMGTDNQTVRAEWGRDLHLTAGVVLLF